MDRRGWLWKKKPSDKITKAEIAVATSESVGSTLSSVAHLGDQQDNCKNKNYVQISMESYTHMSGLEDQVVSLEDQIKALEAKLSAAYSELNNKDDLVKQHAKVAEEAVSGWEKADAEVVSLRRQLESLSLSKLTVDERAAQLDGALKECMKQIRTIKEESEQKLQEVILMKSQQWEKIKLEFEAQIDRLEEGLHEEAGENAALLRSLQESSNRIVKMKEEKSEAEAEVELLKKNSQSKEKELTSLKYELHMISKELDIRNEEKNIIMRSAEVANKQHMEDVKNIAKLEGECQRLRGLLRKKLPGPAALAQIKLEAESSCHVISAPHLRKTYLKSDSLQESEFLTKQLEELEEETKTLKEALASSNAELKASRNLYTKTVGRLKNLEAEIQVFHQERRAQKSILATNYENPLSRIYSNPPSITSISDNGHEDPESPVESCAVSIPDHSDIRRVRSVGKFENHTSEIISDLMDDFLEVEKMACLSDNGSVPLGILSKANDDAEDKKHTSCLSSNQNCFEITDSEGDYLPILKRLQSIISMITISEAKDSNIWKLFGDLQVTVCELRSYLPTTSDCPLCLKSNCNDDDSSFQQFFKTGMPVPVSGDSIVGTEFGITELQGVTAISSIHRFVLTLGRETSQLQGNCYNGHKLDANSEEISFSLNQLSTNKTSLEFVLKLSQALTKTIESHLKYLDCKGKRVDINSTTSLAPNEMYFNTDGCFRQLSSNSDVPKEVVSPGSELNLISSEHSSADFKQMEPEKDDKVTEHDEHMQDLKEKNMMPENMQLLEELKAQLALSHKSYSLTEIQLKCMTEAYKSLQTHVDELEAENKFLKEKMDELKNDLAEEKRCHHDALMRYKEIEETMQRDKCLVCASKSAANNSINDGKDKELAAAEKKLAECQETLYILSRQLQAMCPQIGVTMTHHSKRFQMNEKLVKPTYASSKSYGSCNSNEIDQAEACSISSDIQGVTDEFSSHTSGSTACLSDIEGKNAYGLSHFLSKEKSSH
ncbi:filament-like plant protein 5 isoform X2 [Abrus precatorius]|uniref:Filament-like plant protein 5 isoform X2 n=1 Tax=Abrus precatorius TaxID=3816 RepID=A0A8B8LYQ7_ABRPR|nr:filament-like plant protein 5 isoform X2 [Abrus precatorius]